MYKKISIENSRGIKSFSLEDFKQVNLIYGKNNTCKTTILESLYIMGSPSKPETLLRVNSKRGINTVNSEIWKTFFYKNDISKAIKIFSEFTDKEKREIEINIRKNIELKDTFEGLNIRAIQLKDLEQTPRVINVGVTTSSGNLEYINSRENIKEIPRTWESYYLGLEEILNEIHNNLSILIIKKQFDTIVKILKNIEPNLVQIFLVPPKFIYVDIGCDTLYPLNCLSISFVYTLHIITSLLVSSNRILFIDAIESNLSSNLLELIYTIIFKMAKELNIQVFITTNTTDSLKIFVNSCIKNTPNTTDEIRLYKLERDRKDDSLKYTIFDRKKIESALLDQRR